MFPKTIKFRLAPRINTFCKGGSEWALDVKLDDRDWWTVTVFEKEPKKSVVLNLQDIILKSMEVYHNNFDIPSFKLKVDDNYS